MISPNRIRLLSALIFLPIVGCATILDFQDATELPITATDGTSSSSGSSGESVPRDEAGTPFDAGSKPKDEEEAGTTLIKPPTCAGLCVAPAPEGWTGPLALYEGPPNLAPPSCGGSYNVLAYDGSRDPVAPAAECTCSCGQPSGVTCSIPRVFYYRDRGCTIPCTGSTALTYSCTRTQAPSMSTCDDPDIKGYIVGGSDSSGGSCTPSQTTNVTPPTYGGVARLCAMPTPPSADGGADAGPSVPAVATPDGCGGGEMCSPAPNSGFAANNRCVVRAGSHMCPAAYPAKRTYFDSTKATDSRTCSTCTCGSPNGACGANLSVYSNSTCTSGVTASTAPAACAVFSTSTRITSSTDSSNVACTPSGGAPVGTFAPGDAATVCCEQ